MIQFSPQTQTNIDFAADLFRQSKHAVVLTGAGLSTPSGIPDFRSTGTGLWSSDEPMEVASLHTFRTHPEKFFQWFRPLANQIYYAQSALMAEAFATATAVLTRYRAVLERGAQALLEHETLDEEALRDIAAPVLAGGDEPA